MIPLRMLAMLSVVTLINCKRNDDSHSSSCCGASSTPSNAAVTKEEPKDVAQGEFAEHVQHQEPKGIAEDQSAEHIQHQEPKSITLGELAERIKRQEPTLHIFDANPHEMYEQRHVPGARWVPYHGVTAEVLPKDRSALLVFYCANPQCSASPIAARKAIELGWTNVYVMPDGIFGWVDAGLSVETG